MTAVECVPELHAAAIELTARTGLAGSVEHLCGDVEALERFGGFDVVWLEHVDMHVPGKRGLYARAGAALAPSGRIVWHDWLAGPGGAPRWPLFWSADGAISFLSHEDAFAADLAAAGLERRRFANIAAQTSAWLEKSRRALGGALAKAGATGDGARAARLRGLLTETDNALASIAEERLVPFFAEAAPRP